MTNYVTTAIDSVQYAKTQFLNTFVKEEAIREPLQHFVNAQAQFARQVVASAEKLYNAALEFDFVKTAEKALKPYKPAA